jgi:hypothetical protein
VQQRDAFGIGSIQQPSNLRTISRPAGSRGTTNNADDDAGIPRISSPIAAGIVLLGIYMAMYLAVAGVIHVLTSADAASAASERSTVPASTATASRQTAGANDSPSRYSGEPAADGYPIRHPD